MTATRTTRALGLALLLLPAAASAQLDGIALPRPNFSNRTVTATAVGSRIFHAGLGDFTQFGGRIDLTASTKTPPETDLHAINLSVAVSSLLNDDGGDGFALQSVIGYQLHDHSGGSWKKPGMRVQSGVSVRRMESAGIEVEQWDVPLLVGIDLLPPVSGIVGSVFVSARGQVRYKSGNDADTRVGAGIGAGFAPRKSTGPLHEFGIEIAGDALWLAGRRRELGFSVGIFRMF